MSAAIATKQAPPDGYTLFLANNGLFAVTPAITTDVRFDPVKDFQPITPLVLFPSVLIVPAASPAKTVKELVDYGRSKPSGLSYASQGLGSGGQVMGELLRLKTGAVDDACALSRRGTGGAGRGRRQCRHAVHLLHFRRGPDPGRQDARHRLHRHRSARRSCSDVPTMAEQGFAGIEMDVWHGIVAPPARPPQS